MLGNLFIINQLDLEVDSDRISGYNIVDLDGNFSGNDVILKHKKHSAYGNLLGETGKTSIDNK